MTTNDPVALLHRLRAEPHESEWLEFKLNKDDPTMIGEWVSACANAAILAGKDRAFLVFGVEDQTRNAVGTRVKLNSKMNEGEPFTNWLTRAIEPRLMMEFLDFEDGPRHFAILVIEPTYDRPVRFQGAAYIRVGENTKKLADYPAHERSLWTATNRRKFEQSIAVTHRRPEDIFTLLDVDAFYKLSGQTKPGSSAEILRSFCSHGFIVDDMEGGYDITNLGAILLCRDTSAFPSISSKNIRMIQYAGRDKLKAVGKEVEIARGYAAGFEDLLVDVISRLPEVEVYISGVRRTRAIYPDTAIREIIANSLIHQDFTITGTGPVIEIYSDRIEVTNPGNSLIEVDRIIDERRSRNEKLASTMRGLGLCEERGGGLDKAIIEIERNTLPPPFFLSSQHSMRVVIFGPKEFSKLTKEEKQRACFHHCVVRWIINDYMSNTTLRERFALDDGSYQSVSTIISDATKAKWIVPADPNQGKRNARYVPYWTR